MVPSSRSERSRVVPEGTARADRTMVAHDPWLTLAREAPDEPEKVQLFLLATFAADGGGVMTGTGSATGEARTVAARVATTREQLKETMLAGIDELRYCVVPKMVGRSWLAWQSWRA